MSNTDFLPDNYYGAILAMDVLEHIPHYERVVKRMVESVRVGGRILEKSPFGKGSGGDEDTAVHVGNGGITMKTAMGPNMKQTSDKSWVKQS